MLAKMPVAFIHFIILYTSSVLLDNYTSFWLFDFYLIFVVPDTAASLHTSLVLSEYLQSEKSKHSNFILMVLFSIFSDYFSCHLPSTKLLHRQNTIASTVAHYAPLPIISCEANPHKKLYVKILCEGEITLSLSVS